MLKPERLKKGDTIGIISPSAPLAGLLPHRTKAGIAMLERLGFKVKMGENSLKVTGHTAGDARERASDLNGMFSDREVKAIICAIGGNHSNQMLEYLDFDLIRRNPKIFIGYSDATVLHSAIGTKTGLVTFYGPALLTQFSENPEINKYTLEYFEKAVMSAEPIGKIVPSVEWTDEILDWFSGEDKKRPRTMKQNSGFKWLSGVKANGPIMGGCITSLMHLRETEYWPDFSGSIFFWEIPESDSDFRRGEKIENVDSLLADLKLSGIFKKIKGMVIGRPFGYEEKEVESLESIIKGYTDGLGIPVLLGADIGHTDPIITVPLGVEVFLDSEMKNFELSDSGVI